MLGTPSFPWSGGFEASCEQEVGLCFVFLFLLLNYISLGFSCP